MADAYEGPPPFVMMIYRCKNAIFRIVCVTENGSHSYYQERQSHDRMGKKNWLDDLHFGGNGAEMLEFLYRSNRYPLIECDMKLEDYQ